MEDRAGTAGGVAKDARTIDEMVRTQEDGTPVKGVHWNEAVKNKGTACEHGLTTPNNSEARMRQGSYITPTKNISDATEQEESEEDGRDSPNEGRK